MPTYRGNRGNLLQHWVLVELLGDLGKQGIKKLCYVDAHSMSPTPTRSAKAATDQTAPEFDLVRSRLADGPSSYERAWLELSRSLPSEYPSSAAFVRHCWYGGLHLLLCEADRATADEIQVWLSRPDIRVTPFELHRGDWRERPARPLPTGFDAYYFSFDPNMYDRHDVRPPKLENMYPSDIRIVCDAIAALPAVPMIVQLSTYSVNNANSQCDVIESLVPEFTKNDLAAMYVRADDSMMSFIFSRQLTVASDPENRFQSWLASRTKNG
jgi:hypothetical protein